MNVPPDRREYDTIGFDLPDAATDPVTQWRIWFDDASGGGLPEPSAAIVATVDEHGRPDARAVLVRHADDRGFVFHTNYESTKSRQLEREPHASAVFAWVAQHRQVRVRGPVERISSEESDAYFASRPRGSQISAWASPQSRVLADRAELEALVGATEERFAGQPDVPRPENWGGWRIVPVTVEFWQGRRDRLHDRLLYRAADDSGTLPITSWTIDRLAP
jgi:pyridoxamine 5'-phosphate oxidase